MPLEFERDGDAPAADAGPLPHFEHLQAPSSDRTKTRIARRAATERPRDINHSISASASHYTGNEAPGAKEQQSEEEESRSSACEITGGASGKQMDTNESSQLLRSMEYCNHMQDSDHNGQQEGRPPFNDQRYILI